MSHPEHFFEAGGSPPVFPPTEPEFINHQDEHEESSPADPEPSEQRTACVDLPPRVMMSQSCYQNILHDLGGTPHEREQGGILLGPKDCQSLVIQYVKDKWGESRPASFTIDAARLNAEIRNASKCQLTAVGIVHSHPAHCTRPSYGDLVFLRSIFSIPKNSGGMFFFPIVSGGVLYPYVVDTDNVDRIQYAELVLI